jgi:hypothetical protein
MLKSGAGRQKSGAGSREPEGTQLLIEKPGVRSQKD